MAHAKKLPGVLVPYAAVDMHEAIARANALPFGVAPYAFADPAAASVRVIQELQYGNLWINHYVASLAETPFAA